MLSIASSPSRPLLAILYWVLALSYLATMQLGQYPLHYLHKASPILLLLLLVNKTVIRNHQLLVIAILFSACGDVLLALPIDGGFVFGLGAFLVAQCCYGWLFRQWWQWQNRKWVHIGLLVALTLTVSAMILPTSGDLFTPVLVYMLAIFFMACSGVLVKTSDPLILLGAISFVISDSVIALNKFSAPVPYEGYWIMSTYYLAQFLIVFGCINRIDDARSR